MMQVVRINGDNIHDRETFHSVFAAAFGFPAFYGENMDAWIDCMSYLAYPEAEMSTIHAPPGGVVTLVIDNVKSFQVRCPEQYVDLVECSAFVNWRQLEDGSQPVLALAFYA